MPSSSQQLKILFTLATTVLLTGLASAQSNVRDFGPSTYRRNFNRAPAVYNVANYAAAPVAAYASPYAQVGYQPIVAQRPAGCGYNYNAAYRAYTPNPSAYGAYTAGYAPYSGGNASFWSSTTPAQYSGNSLFGTQTVYGKEEPFRNVFRYFVP